jgi:hypothetical protein
MQKIERIKSQGEALFSKRGQLMTLWQEIAENFYPERADFTATKSLGDEFADHLETSYPLLARRDLGNQIGGMLRPTSKDWFKIIKQYDENLDIEAKAWLEWAAKTQKRAMYDPVAMFTRATKEGDHDWAAFGQCVISCRFNPHENALLHRCWHLRDVAWQEDDIGRIGTVYRKWKPTALALNRIFKNVHWKVAECAKKDPYKEMNVWHLEVPAETYDGDWGRFPTVSIYYDVDNNFIMEEIGVWEGEYVIPRWQTVSGSQYAFSPATVAALPDARLIQSIARILLDAGEKAIDPPMLAVQEAIRSDISIYAGGITWVDAEYDERLGEVLREMPQGGNIPVGFEMNKDTREMIAEAFFLNTLTLPAPDREMTAYETGQRVQEYIRQALPLFEPMETEYNGALCEKDFNILMRHGAFGDPRSMPKSLHGGDITFQFESPLKDATERAKGQRFMEGKEMIASAMELDSGVRHIVDPTVALRDVLEGIGVPAKWQRSESEVEEMNLQDAQSAEAQQLLQVVQQGADIAKTVGEADAGE